MIPIEKLLLPIPGSDPCGIAHNESETYSKVEEALQRELAPTQGAAASKRDWKEPDWSKAETLIAKMLQEESKDFRLFAHLTQIQSELHGLEGLNAVVRLATRLVETFGIQLYPRAGSDDARSRTWGKQMSNFDSRLESCLEGLQRRPGSEPGSPVTNAGLQTFALALAELKRMAVEKLQLAESSIGFPKARERIEGMQLTMEDSQSHDGSSAGSIAGTSASPANPGGSQSAGERPSLASGPGLPLPAPPGGFATAQVGQRAAAVAQLRVVRDFFRQTEPHNPVALLLDQAIRWADMPLEQWLAQVLDEGDTLSSLRSRLGIAQPDSRE